MLCKCPTDASVYGLNNIRFKSTRDNLKLSSCERWRTKSIRPTNSRTLRMPKRAMISRNSWAINFIKFSTYSGLPVNLARNFSSCVATPYGHVFIWQTRAIRQPTATNGKVPNPNNSAPNKAAIATS